MLRIFLTSAFVLAIYSPVLASTTVNGVLADTQLYDGQHITVSGFVQRLQERISHKGNAYDVFDLCAGRCMRVFAAGRPQIAGGERVTVNGTFSAVKHVGTHTIYSELKVDNDAGLWREF
jgi:hypothetical protein